MKEGWYWMREVTIFEERNMILKAFKVTNHTGKNYVDTKGTRLSS